MSNTIFSDEVVLATDLKKRQRYWLSRAREKGGVTVMQGHVADLVLAPRRHVAAAEEAVSHVKAIAPFLRELITLERSPADSSVFPWLRDLDESEQKAFLRELLDVFAASSNSGNWAALDTLIEDWRATAEASHNDELVEAWRTRGQADDYVPATVVRVESI